MRYKIIARPKTGSGFTHKVLDTLEEAEETLEKYENDPDLIKRRWRFWIYEER